MKAAKSGFKARSGTGKGKIKNGEKFLALFLQQRDNFKLTGEQVLSGTAATEKK